MIIVRLQGGLGNQLFQYAIGRSLALRRRVELKFDLSWYADPPPDRRLREFSRPLELNNFRVQLPVATSREIRRVKRHGRIAALCRGRIRDWLGCGDPAGRSHQREEIFLYDPRWTRWPDTIYLDGYWQSPHYFNDIAPVLREEFQLQDATLAAEAARIAAGHRDGDWPLVAVHVRRGDLAHARDVLRTPSLVHGPPVTVEYLAAAMQLFPPQSRFLVFSDSAADLEWCRDRLQGENSVFLPGRTALQDFALMQCCDHNIISNSTFSWWAAWLNAHSQKHVVAPRRWFYDLDLALAPLDCLIPRQWTLL